MRRKRRQTQTLNFVHWFCLLRVVSSVRPLFGANSQNGARKFSLPYILVTSVQLPSIFLSCLIANSLKMSRPLSSAWCQQEEHPFPLVPHLCRRPGISGVFFFSSSSSTNGDIHPWLADPRVPWTKALYVCLFSHFFFLSLSFNRN